MLGSVPVSPLLLYAALLLQLGALPPRAAPPPPVGGSAEDRLLQATRLLNLAIDRNILQSFPLWDSKAGQLRPHRPGEKMDDSTPILILHLWATWCGPCKAEFQTWRNLAPQISELHRGRVRVFHIAMQNEADEMPAFVKEMGKKLPFGAKYFDSGERLAKNLAKAFPNKRLPPLPMTLWLDHERIVRWAIIGPVDARVTAVKDATAQLLRTIEQQESGAQRLKDSDDEADVFSH